MDHIPTVPLVICSLLLLLLVIMTVSYWCCNHEDDNDNRDWNGITEDKVRCLRLQINAGSNADSVECINIFELGEDQPPPYEYPPTYKSLHCSTSRAADVLSRMSYESV